jgi:hypothetical protein
MYGKVGKGGKGGKGRKDEKGGKERRGKTRVVILSESEESLE